MNDTMTRIYAGLCALCLFLCLAPTFQAAQTDGFDDLEALQSLYEAGMELEQTGFPVLENNRISIREVPEEATGQADLLVVEIVPDESLEAHTADLVLQMFIRGDKEQTLRQEIRLVPGETVVLAFLAASDDLPSGCFRAFLMDEDDNRLSPPAQCYGTVTLNTVTGGSGLEFLGPYVPQEHTEEAADHDAGALTDPAPSPTTVPPTTAPQETEPPATKPKETEPKETEPKETEPKETEPKETEPKETEPKETEPKETEPKETEPKETEPPVTEPKETEPKETEPKETEPKETEPKETEPKETEPPVTEPQETECPELPDVDPSDTPIPEETPTLPSSEPSQPITEEIGKDVEDDILDFED